MPFDTRILSPTVDVVAPDGESECVVVAEGTALTIPTGAKFQFRNTGTAPLCFVIATMPPWPGETEAVRVTDYWPVDSEASC